MSVLSDIASADSIEEAVQHAVAHLEADGARAGIWTRDATGVVHVAGSLREPATAVEVALSPGAAVLVETRPATSDTEDIAAILASTAARVSATERARRVEQRLRDSERVGRMGSFEWSIEQDANDWSEELYRVYGLDPGQDAPSFEQFIALLDPSDRERVRGILGEAIETGQPYQVEERILRPDGQRRILWSCGEVKTDDDGNPISVVGVCRDVTEQRAAADYLARANRRVAAAEEQRRQAIELNDTVVQGLVAMLWRLEDRDPDDSRVIAEATLASAKRMMADLLRSAGDDGARDVLVRSSHAELELPGSPLDRIQVDATSDVASCDGGGGTRRVVIADDAPEVRTLLRIVLQRQAGIEVVGEAEDGAKAIQLVRTTRPDIVVLDLSMPVLDGLAAATRIRTDHPDVRIVVFSGYPEESMRSRAIEAGADEYVEKVASLDGIVSCVTALPSRVV